MTNLIEINNLTKKYKQSKNINVLKNLSFKFKKGKIYSIIGPSGSGKSTLLNLISLIDEPTSGKIKINEKNIDFKEKKTNDLIRAKEIGIIYQDKNLLTDFTALENVYLARLNAISNKNNAVIEAKKIISKVGLSSRMNHFPSQLSGGESQRIAICRALINSPNIILADEPTGNLDYKNSKEVFSYFLKLKEKNKIILIATHNRELAKKADYTLSLVNGNIKRLNER